MKTHLLSVESGPAVCGVGQGRRLGAVRGFTVDQLRFRPDLQARIDCVACTARARQHFPGDVELLPRPRFKPR